MQKQALLKDPLTGVYSRAMLNARLEEELDRAHRYQQPFSLLLLDLDHFKSINDAFGHPRGDRVLVEFAAELVRSIRAADSVFRFGGDEFVILLPNTIKEKARNTAERLIEKIQAHKFTSNPPLSISLSIGLAAYPEDESTPEGLFDVADRRHQLAKRLGRSQVISETPLLSSRKEIEAPSRLIEQDQALSAVYQFLDSLPSNNRSVLHLTGLPGSGKTRLQAEIRKIARLRGYAVMAISSRPAVKNRNYAALMEAQEQLPGFTFSPEENFPGQALSAYLLEKGQSGIVITIDQLADLDHGTLNFLRELFNSSELSQLGLVYSDDETGSSKKFPNNIPLQETIRLKPISPAGLRIWLRQSLQWEAPSEFVAWLHQQTGGLPGNIKAALDYLNRHHILRLADTGCEFPSELLQTTISAGLRQLPVTPPNNLPSAWVEIVDRVQELEDLKSLVQNEMLVSLVGPAGSGKSTLALQAASEILQHFPDGVYIIDLESTHGPVDLLPLIASTLRLAGSRSDDNEDLLSYLHNREMLLILDGWHPACGDPAAVETLRARCSGLHLMVATHIPLAIPGEIVFELHGLDYPSSPADHGMLRDAVRFAACTLFIQSAQRVSSGFQSHPASATWMAQICRLVEGLPLAIEQAAAWVQTFDCEEIATRIAQSQARQVEQDIPADRRTVYAVLDAFWDLLSPNDQHVLFQLTVFCGPFHRESAQKVSGASPFFLDALAAKALLRKTPQGYYRLPAVLRDFLQHKSAATAEQIGELSARHARSYGRLAGGLSTDPDQELPHTAYQAIAAEWENYLAAWNWSLTNRTLETVQQLLCALSPYFRIHGNYLAALQMFSSALETLTSQPAALQAEDVNTTNVQLEAELALQCGQFAYLAGDYQASSRLLTQAGEQFASCENPARRARTYLLLARTETALNQQQQHLEHLQASLEIYQSLENEAGISDVYNRLGISAANDNDFERALSFFTAALETAQRLADLFRTARCLNNLGQLALYHGDRENANQHLHHSLQIAQSLEDPNLIAAVLDSLAKLSVQAQQYQQADNYLRQALVIARRLQSVPLAIELILSTAEMWGESGRQPAATALLCFLLEQRSLVGNDRLRVKKRYEQYAHRLSLAQIELAESIHRGKSLHLLLDELIESNAELDHLSDPKLSSTGSIA